MHRFTGKESSRHIPTNVSQAPRCNFLCKDGGVCRQGFFNLIALDPQAVKRSVETCWTFGISGSCGCAPSPRCHAPDLCFTGVAVYLYRKTLHDPSARLQSGLLKALHRTCHPPSNIFNERAEAVQSQIVLLGETARSTSTKRNAGVQV